MQVGTLKGVLWHQGESDTVEQTRTAAYEKRLHRLIEDVREDLGNSKHHNRPPRPGRQTFETRRRS